MYSESLKRVAIHDIFVIEVLTDGPHQCARQLVHLGPVERAEGEFSNHGALKTEC